MKRLNIALMGLWFGLGGMAGYYWERGKSVRELKEIQEIARETYEERLADPHHCISICQQEWERQEKGGKYETGKNNK